METLLKGLGGLILLVLIFLGWPAVVWLVYNAVATVVGLPNLGYWVVFGIMFLLSVVGGYFKTQVPS